MIIDNCSVMLFFKYSRASSNSLAVRCLVLSVYLHNDIQNIINSNFNSVLLSIIDYLIL